MEKYTLSICRAIATTVTTGSGGGAIQELGLAAVRDKTILWSVWERERGCVGVGRGESVWV